MKTIILGAGMAGITCAKALKQAGHEVLVFDKARGPSGRMSSKRSEVGTFDHGAPLFRAHDDEFKKAVEGWIVKGWVVPWSPRWSGDLSLSTSQWYTAKPRMSALLRNLSEDLECHWQERATSLEKLEKGWKLGFESGKTIEARRVVSTLPAPQASELLREALPTLSESIGSVPFHGTWTALFDFEAPLELEWDIHREGKDCLGPLHTIVRESRKPGRDPGERLVVHGLDSWSDDNIELEKEEALVLLREALQNFLGELPKETFGLAHRWRYAHSSSPWEKPHFWDDGLGVAGDWCLGAGVGAAWASGYTLSQKILAE